MDGLRTALTVSMAAVVLLGISACGDAEHDSGQHDPARAIMDELASTERDELDKFEAGYSEVLSAYPDSPEFAVAGVRLINLYARAYGAPKHDKVAEVAEALIARRPEFRQDLVVQSHLLRAYKELGRHADVVRVYEFNPALARGDVPPGSRGMGAAVDYAHALARVGREDEARVWYEKVVALPEDDYAMFSRKEALRELKRLTAND